MLTSLQKLGIVIFVLSCGLPAMEINNFGFGTHLTLQTALLCAFIGGSIGGILICPSPWIAGLLGGIAAGPLGLLAIYYYTLNRHEVYHLELVLVQGIASLPGFGLGYLIKRILTHTGNPP